MGCGYPGTFGPYSGQVEGAGFGALVFPLS